MSDRSRAARSRTAFLIRLLLLAGVFAAGAEPRYIVTLLSDRSRERQMLERLPDRFAPELPQFLDLVRKTTPRDATIALAVPMRQWGEGYANGYSYAYYRARYLLAGRTVVPLITPDERRVPSRVRQCDYVAAWRIRTVPPGFTAAAHGAGGTLYVRRR